MFEVVRVIGEVRKVWRGWERRDHLKVNDRPLNGFIRVRKQNGNLAETTCFGGKEVQGYQLVWLGRLNDREEFQSQPEPEVVEVAKSAPNKVKKVKPLTKRQILEKVQSGELTADQAVELLTKAA